MIARPALATALALLAQTALAAPACNLPSRLAPAPARAARPGETIRGVQTASYVLALSWSPEYCRTRRDRPADRLQCRDNAFGFVLHGLWPNGAGRDHPRNCAPAPPLPEATLRRHLCMTPSAELLQHEWAAHGTCGWRDSAAYFEQAARLWSGVSKPSLADADRRPYTAGDLRAAFVRANPGLPRSAVAIRLDNRQRLTEVQLCYDLRFRPSACKGGSGAPDRLPIRITPVARR